MSILSFIQKKREENDLLIDIGNGSISMALVSFTENLPRFVYFTKASFPAIEKTTSSKLTTDMAILLEKTLVETAKSNKKIRKVLISFSSPWYVFKTREIKISKDKNFTIDSSFLNKIAIEEAKQYLSELTAVENDIDSDNFTIIEKSIVHTKINGYAIKNILKKKTKTFDAFIYISAISSKIEKRVTDLVSKYTHISKTNIISHTFPLISFSVIRDDLTTKSDFLFIDITAEVTDLSLIAGDCVLKNASFPLGRNYIVRKIAKTAKVSLEIAESMIHMYLEQKTSATGSKLLEKVLTDIEKEWAIYFEDVFETLSENTIVPTEVFITADIDTAPIFTNFMRLEKTDITSLFRKNIKINIISPELLSHLYTSTPDVRPDEFVILLAGFYGRHK